MAQNLIIEPSAMLQAYHACVCECVHACNRTYVRAWLPTQQLCCRLSHRIKKTTRPHSLRFATNRGPRPSIKRIIHVHYRRLRFVWIYHWPSICFENPPPRIKSSRPTSYIPVVPNQLPTKRAKCTIPSPLKCPLEANHSQNYGLPLFFPTDSRP